LGRHSPFIEVSMSNETKCAESPAALVAIIRAARAAGDRELERAARRDLAERFKMRVVFERGEPQGVANVE